jgi:Spy/CpxP family protein refolding chaperone
MQDEAQRLGQLVRQTTIDEEAAMAAAIQVMELEVKVKKAHMRLLIQIKNLLDPTQQEKLIQLRSE